MNGSYSAIIQGSEVATNEPTLGAPPPPANDIHLPTAAAALPDAIYNAHIDPIDHLSNSSFGIASSSYNSALSPLTDLRGLDNSIESYPLSHFYDGPYTPSELGENFAEFSRTVSYEIPGCTSVVGKLLTAVWKYNIQEHVRKFHPGDLAEGAPLPPTMLRAMFISHDEELRLGIPADKIPEKNEPDLPSERVATWSDRATIAPVLLMRTCRPSARPYREGGGYLSRFSGSLKLSEEVLNNGLYSDGHKEQDCGWRAACMRC
ncbi:hypothetical protein B0H21DRAFT_883432 [Amylocystis lapponica]|nr:hypothetical protein B0H21DRAFT_883432 [Amylocystis lapponica]